MLTKVELFHNVLLLMTMGVCVACTSTENRQTSVAPSLIATSPTSGIEAISTPAPTSLVPLTASASVPTVQPQDIAVEPIVTATMVRLESWSPDGKFLAYWTFDAEQLFDYSYPPGILFMLNSQTGEICSYPDSGAYTGQPSLIWQPDGRVLILNSDPPKLGRPCSDDFATVNDLTNVLPELIDGSLSPDGNHKAITKVLDVASFMAETSILNTLTEAVENTVQWKYWDGIGNPGAGQWLSTDQYLINETLDQGPLIVSVGKGIVRVAPEILRQSIECGQECHLIAKGMPVAGTDTYHLVLSGVGNVSNFPLIRLFHSETREIEEFDFRQGGFFSPDGRWLFFYEEIANTQSRQPDFQIWIRPVDPIGSEANLLVTADANPLPPAWASDSTKLAIPSSTGVTVFLLSNGTVVGAWKTDAYQIIESLWSPDSRFLALRGDMSLPGSQEALFLLQVP